MNPFSGRRNTRRLPPMAADVAARQGRIATLAWDAFQDRDAMKDFLNTHDAVLGGRPIDLAIASAAGLSAVEDALRRAAANPRDHSIDSTTGDRP